MRSHTPYPVLCDSTIFSRADGDKRAEAGRGAGAASMPRAQRFSKPTASTDSDTPRRGTWGCDRGLCQNLWWNQHARCSPGASSRRPPLKRRGHFLGCTCRPCVSRCLPSARQCARANGRSRGWRTDETRPDKRPARGCRRAPARTGTRSLASVAHANGSFIIHSPIKLPAPHQSSFGVVQCARSLALHQ